METNKKLSKYINNPIADKKNIFLSNLFDYFITLIATLFIFYIGLIVSSSLPVTTKTVDKYNLVTKEVKDFINTTHLAKYDLETGAQTSVETDASNYLKCLVKTSAYIYDLKYPLKNEDSTYDTENKVKLHETFLYQKDEYKLDNISYFYYVFSSSNTELKDYVYEEVDYKDNLDTFIYLKTMGYETLSNYNDMFIKEDNPAYNEYKEVLPRFLILDKELTTSLTNRLVYNDVSDTNAGYAATNIKTAYKNGIDYAIKLVEKKSNTYKDLAKQFETVYTNYARIGLVTYLISYVFSYVAMFGLGRAMAGSFITISQKTRSLGLARKDEGSPNIGNMIIYHIVNFFIQLSSCILVFMFTGYTGIFNITLFGPINIFVIELVLIVFTFTSILTTLVSKDGQSLALILSKMVLKDTKTYEDISLEIDNDKKEK